MTRRILVGIFAAGSMVALAATAAGPTNAKGGNPHQQPPSILDPDDIPRCVGNQYHQSHEYPDTSCRRLFNPHFGHLFLSFQSCESPTAGHLNCNGCYGCCNGMYDEQEKCHCKGLTSCLSAATSARVTCQGNCTGNYEGDGCTRPNIRI